MGATIGKAPDKAVQNADGRVDSKGGPNEKK
jgi:hypothetical protein